MTDPKLEDYLWYVGLTLVVVSGILIVVLYMADNAAEFFRVFGVYSWPVMVFTAGIILLGAAAFMEGFK